MRVLIVGTQQDDQIYCISFIECSYNINLFLILALSCSAYISLCLFLDKGTVLKTRNCQAKHIDP
jgi:hypothetical protein